MDKNSRIVVGIIVVALVLSVGVTFWRIFIARDYAISFDVACDPASERCFVKTCTPDDPANNPCLDEKASVEYSKTLQMDAHLIPACDETNDNCSRLSCTGQSTDECREILCDASAELPDGTTCNDPATYQPPAPTEPIPSDTAASTPGVDMSNNTPETTTAPQSDVSASK